MKRTVTYEAGRGEALSLGDLEKVIEDADALKVWKNSARPKVVTHATRTAYADVGTIRKITFSDTPR